MSKVFLNLAHVSILTQKIEKCKTTVGSLLCSFPYLAIFHFVKITLVSNYDIVRLSAAIVNAMNLLLGVSFLDVKTIGTCAPNTIPAIVAPAK